MHCAPQDRPAADVRLGSKTAVTWGCVRAFQQVSSTPNGLEMTLTTFKIWLCATGRGSGAKLVGIESGVISGLNLASQIRRLAAAEGDNANDDRYSKLAGW
jgi:hypothetical protein